MWLTQAARLDGLSPSIKVEFRSLMPYRQERARNAYNAGVRPLTVITGILLGSCFSIAFSLAAVLVIFAILGNAHPRLNEEFPSLLTSFAIFTLMTAISAWSFYALLKGLRLRWLAQILLWSGLFATGYYYWP